MTSARALSAVEVLVTQSRVIEILEVARQGPAGPRGAPGPAGDGSQMLLVAGSTLSGHRMVCLDAGVLAYASNDEPSHAVRVLGLTLGAIESGAEGLVQRGGAIVEPTWAWVPEAPVFLGVSGALTQTAPTAPTAAFLLPVGIALTTTSILLALREPILLR